MEVDIRTEDCILGLTMGIVGNLVGHYFMLFHMKYELFFRERRVHSLVSRFTETDAASGI